MSDKNRDIKQLEEENALLKNALNRERNAKKLIQQKLEDKQQENFSNNRDFLKAFQQATSRQVQLQFLANLTNGMLEVDGIEEMLCSFVGNVSNIISQFSAFELRIIDQKPTQLSKLSIDFRHFDTIPWQDRFEGMSILISDELADDNWHRFELSNHQELTSLAGIFSHGTLLCFRFQLSDTDARLIILDIDHYCYSQEFKQTLNTASQQISMAIKRRISEQDLDNNYQALKRTLNELESAQHQLIHNEKMASLGQLAAGVAHEVNNPLGYISSNLEVLREYFMLYQGAFEHIDPSAFATFDKIEDLDFANEDTEELISSCIKGIKRIASIVSSLKSFSRKDNDEFESTDINTVIENTLSVVWNSLKYDYELHKNLAENLPQIHANSGQLQQVFINLVLNAIHAMKGVGTLTITTELIKDTLKVCFSDTGCGMSEETRQKLFEPFFTTKSENEGTGLGLSVSYAIIEKHEATIRVSSALGKGSTFELHFPIWEPSNEN